MEVTDIVPPKIGPLIGEGDEKPQTVIIVRGESTGRGFPFYTVGTTTPVSGDKDRTVREMQETALRQSVELFRLAADAIEKLLSEHHP